LDRPTTRPNRSSVLTNQSTTRQDRSPTISERPPRNIPSDREREYSSNRFNRTNSDQRFSGNPSKYRFPPPSVVKQVRQHFNGYHYYWTPDWYHRYPHAWYPYWIPSYRWWYHPSWYDTWGWFGVGFFTGVVVNEIVTPYPYYYGNNIVYRNGFVYVNGVPYVSAAEYYRQAARLAQSTNVIIKETVREIAEQPVVPILAPDLSDHEINNGTNNKSGNKKVQQTAAKPVDDDSEKNWLPMGTFTILDANGNEKKGNIFQFAVNKNGQIRGNYFNEETEKIRQIVGAVDSKSQRVAFRFTDEEKTVFECGLWNLTQDSLPLLVHYDEKDSEQLTLIRLKKPETDEQNDSKELNDSMLIESDNENMEELAP
jgi:flagellar hook protein FlgE